MTADNRTVQTDGVTLATQSFGIVSDPTVLLIMGSTASMLSWPDELCFELAAKGFFVIRYDNRDTGLSTTYPPGSPPYAVEDMAADLLAIMDAYGADHAHLVGMSLGGLIAQIAALSAPDRVLTITLIGSEPLGWDGEPLPHISSDFLDHFATFSNLDWSNRRQVRAFLLEVEQLCAGSAHPFDAARAGDRVEAVMTRSPNLASAFNHGLVQLREDWTGRFRDIKQQVLVIHGEEDPILPLPNGEALFTGISGARLIALSGVGHELPLEATRAIIDGIKTMVAPSVSPEHNG